MSKYVFLWFIGLVFFATLLAIYPLRAVRRKVVFLGFLAVIPILIAFAYAHWGAWSDWQAYAVKMAREAKAKEWLARVKSPDEIISRMKERLRQQPKSAKGWYLLGRLYAAQGQWPLARDAFFKAHKLRVNNESYTLNYAQSLWELNQQQFNEPIRSLYKSVLQMHPNQPDALLMLARDAYTEKKYDKAIAYWQTLLSMVSPQSKEAKALRKAIAKAEKERPKEPVIPT